MIDLEWKVTFVGSAESSQYDQVLVSVLVGPNSRGKNRFLLETDPPDPHKIPAQDVLGVTALLLTCSFRDREFIRVGYYINVEVKNMRKVVEIDNLVFGSMIYLN